MYFSVKNHAAEQRNHAAKHHWSSTTLPSNITTHTTTLQPKQWNHTAKQYNHAIRRLSEVGGWTNREIVSFRFVRASERAGEARRSCMCVRETMCFLVAGYFDGRMSSARARARAAH